MKILHLMNFEKFIRHYVEFIDKNLDINDHSFFIIGKDYKKYNLEGLPNLVIVDNYLDSLRLLFKMQFAKKMIIHGLWNEKIIKLLLLQPWHIRKCYWMMWGGDFYNYENESTTKKILIKKLKHFVTFIKGDFEFVKKWYGATGTYHECILYPVAIYEELISDSKHTEIDSLKILVGNSADPSNNHKEIFERLLPFKDLDIEVIVPLSYGNPEYANSVVQLGNQLFGNKFKALLDFIPLEDYKSMLKTIGIGIFNHGRQQGLGNIITLLSYGKKVFLRKDITTWDALSDLGLSLNDIQEFNLEPLDDSFKLQNIEVVKKYFSRENYCIQLKKVFYS